MMKFADTHPTPMGGTPVLPPRPRVRYRRRWWSAALIVAAVAAAAVAADRLRTPQAPPTEAASPAADGPAPPAVSTVRPARQTVRKTIEQPGRVEGYEQTPVYVKIPGYVKTWKADIGDRVAAGQVLAELAVPEETEELRRREAAVALARADVTASEKALEAAKADVVRTAALIRQAKASRARAEAGHARWKNEFDRNSKLVGSGAVSRTDFDTVQDQFRAAEASLDETLAAVESATAANAASEAARIKAEADVAVARAKLAVSEADARRQAAFVAYATVTAPFTGVISQRNIDTGHYVMPPTSGATMPPLFVVVRTDPVRVFVDVPETEAAQITTGHQAGVRVQSLFDKEIAGKVTRSSWALDQATRTLRVQIDLPNPAGELRPGMYATARLVLERPGAWVVPAGVVSTSDEQPYAVRVEGGKSVKTPVKLGGRQGGTVELLAKQTKPAARGEPIAWEPLTGTEEFMTSRPAGWSDGMAVAVK